MKLKRSVGLVALGTAMATLVIVAPALSETVTERGGSVDRDDEVTGEKDSFGADAVDPVAGTLSKTFHAPDPLTFRDFTEGEQQNQAPESKIDLILSEGWSKDDVAEGAESIGVDLLSNDFENANGFPILADGNLSGGSAAGDGDGGKNPHWAAKVYTSEGRARLLAVPKVLSANTQYDVPFYFRIEDHQAVTINNVEMVVEINGDTTIIDNIVPDHRIKAGDAVTDDGTSETNGETNAYTVLVDNNTFSGVDLSSTGHFRSDEVRAMLNIEFSDDGGHTFYAATEWVDLHGFLDKNIEVVHLGDLYSQNNGTHPALSPDSNAASQDSWREATPYTHMFPTDDTSHKWGTHKDDNIGTWWEHSTQTENVEWCPTIGWIYRCRNAPYGWIDGGWYNLAVRHDGGHNPLTDSDEKWQELMASEERGAVFVWYWGSKVVTDVQGIDRDVLDLRKKTAVIAVVELYPGAEVHLIVGEVDNPEPWNWGSAVGSATGIAGGIVTVATAGAGPIGWIAAGVGYATIVMASGSEIENILGGISHVPSGQQGARASAFGVATINKADGDPISGQFYGDPNQGLGGPNLSDFIQLDNGTKTKGASVVLNQYSPQALQTWKVMHSTTAAAWAVNKLFDDEDARAGVRFVRSDTHPDADRCKVDSDAVATNADDQYVGEGAE